MNPLVIAATVYAAMSVVAFQAYLVDKRAATLGRRRIPETSLHLLELLGGWPGALLAQRLIRHKNAKIGYQVVFWAIGMTHAAGWVMVWRQT